MYRVSYFLLALVLFSCNSDDDSNVEQQRSEGDIFFGLQVGNEWNYDYFKVGIDDELVNTGVKLHVEITGESIIDGEHLYYTMTKTATGNDIASSCTVCPADGTEILRVRDSLGFLIDLNGGILFSRLSNREVELYPIGHVATARTQLVSGVPEITVPAGTFPSLDNEVFARGTNGERFPATYNTYYSAGIGGVKETYGAVSSQNLIGEKQLVSYTIQ